MGAYTSELLKILIDDRLSHWGRENREASFVYQFLEFLEYSMPDGTCVNQYRNVALGIFDPCGNGIKNKSFSIFVVRRKVQGERSTQRRRGYFFVDQISWNSNPLELNLVAKLRSLTG